LGSKELSMVRMYQPFTHESLLKDDVLVGTNPNHPY